MQAKYQVRDCTVFKKLDCNLPMRKKDEMVELKYNGTMKLSLSAE
jgi:hypothetical protein